MKALTLWQPWASFMVALPSPPKTIETRGWSTNYRGPLAIHAAKSEPRDVRDWFSFGPERSLLMRHFAHLAAEPSVEDVFAELPRGCILGTVDLFDVRPTSLLTREGELLSELFLGDYSDGRFGWMTRNARRFEPIPCKGRQGLWDVPAEVMLALGTAGAR